MKALEKLPQVVSECLGGLEADQALYQRMLARRAQGPRPRRVWQRAVALVASLVFVLGMGAAGLHALNNRRQEPTITTMAAGQELKAGVLRADVPRGSITLKASGTPRYKGLWASGKGANFPLIRVRGASYRLLTNPTQIDSSMLGANLGSVELLVEEPALDTSGGIISNVTAKGAAVHAVSGMQGSAIAAEVDGKLRVFQRVSFGGQALTGGESLQSTLAGKVSALQISGIGTVTDDQKAQELMQKLFSGASYKSAASRLSDQALLIQYDNGIVLQMALKGSSLMACGTWEAQAFLDAFSEAASQ